MYFKFLNFIKDKTSRGIVILERWKEMEKYEKDEKTSAKICNRDVTK
jgi:hypothetical protein